MSELDKLHLHVVNKHTLLFNAMEKDLGNLPNVSSDVLHELYAALCHFHGNRHVDWTCKECVTNFLKDCMRMKIDLTLKYHTFPKQD